MPFVLRVVEPKYLSRTSLHDEEGLPKVKDDELLAVTNCTLSNALKQLASLVLLADDIFSDLTAQLNEVTQRSGSLQTRIRLVGEKVEQYDPRKVPVPEGDLSAFALRKDHYVCKTVLTTDIFTPDTRPECVRELYLAAGRTSPGGAPGRRRSSPVQCTPVLGAGRRRLREKVNVEIETRLPAAIEELRRWTSSEALGDLTVMPGGLVRISCARDDNGMSSDDENLDHKLPSPEEQITAIISKFPPEVVPIDTSGRGFDRMCTSRRSLLHVDTSCERTLNGDSQTVKRRTRSRKPRGKRRNTITGTDQKEIRDAIAGEASSPADEPESPDSGAVMRSHSSDLLKKNPFDHGKKSHFNSLKEWGRSRLRLMSRSPSDSGRESSKTDKNKSKSPTVQDIDDVNIYETVTMRRRKIAAKQQDRKISHERNNSYSSSEKSISMPISMPMSGALSLAVKLREASSAGRRRRTVLGTTGPLKDEPHSSSGNWSASSESGRTSIGSEITSTTAAPRSSTSAATSSNSLNIPHGPPSSIVSRRRFLNTSGSGSVTSEGTLTPDIIHDLHDDMETSSEFSCDTEGYYTSFHMDSGLKTLKEEEISLPITPLHTTNTFTNSSGNQTVLTAENEYELFGKGSTSTTTSSAGTVCTTLLAAGSDRSLVLGPAVPERKSSLSKLNKSRSSSGNSSINLDRSNSSSTTGSNSERIGTIKRNTLSKNTRNSLPILNTTSTQKTEGTPKDDLAKTNQETVVVVVHQTKSSLNQNTGAESPDSGHNTSSSPVDDSVSSAHGAKLSLSELDYSESSDLEGFDRIERIRVKTTINSSRIPSMCVITPNNSDDESVKSSKQNPSNVQRKSDNEITAQDKETEGLDIKQRISSRPKLDLPLQETDLDTLVFNDNVQNRNSLKNLPLISKPEDLEVKPIETLGQASNFIQNKLKNIKKQTTSKQADSQKPSSTRSYKPLNSLMSRLKEAFPQKLSLKKSPNSKESPVNEPLYADNGEYVTIADYRNNNQKTSGVYYSNDVVKRNLQTVLSGKLQETEYVSLNELPANISSEAMESPENMDKAQEANLDAFKRHGARVTLDSAGKVIFSSDSLRRRKGAHTTFEPGPFVKDAPVAEKSPSVPANTESVITEITCVDGKTNTPSFSPKVISQVILPKTTQDNQHFTAAVDATRPLSPQLGKVVIRAPIARSNATSPTSEVVRMPPMNIVTPNNAHRPMSPKNIVRGAYVNIQDAQGISLSPTKDNDQDYRHSSADQVQCSHPVYSSQQAAYREIPRVPGTNIPIANQQLPNQQPFRRTNLTDLPNQRNIGNTYWTLQPQKPDPHLMTDPKTLQRSVTPDITRGLHSIPDMNLHQNTFRSMPEQHTQPLIYARNPEYTENIQQPLYPPPYTNAPLYSADSYGRNINYPPNNFDLPPETNNSFVPFSGHNNLSIGRTNILGYNNDSLKMSPIDPRSKGRFQSSTPTHNISTKENATVGIDQVSSPLKSTMSNEELYAVIHKSKKKMNIKSPSLERAGSPALSVTSLSPGSSESSIPGRITPVKMPETGYLADARARHSWSPNIQDGNFVNPDGYRLPENIPGRPQDVGSRQSWACSDRLGPAPQTSRLDFKKILLQHGVKLNFQYANKPPPKVSAVERLKLSKDTPNMGQSQDPNQSNINILDLSGSPKTYTQRRFMRLNNPAPSSPSRTNALIKEHKSTPKILLSPKTQWRFSSPRSDVLSSPIPEAFNEDDSPNGVNDKDHRQIMKDYTIKTLAAKSSPPGTAEIKPMASFRRSLIPTIRENVSTEGHVDSGISPIKDNLFLKTQENNFMKSEQQALNTFGQQPNKIINTQGKMTRAEFLQAQKAQFLSQNLPTTIGFNTPIVSSQFKPTSASDSAVQFSPIATNRISESPKCPSPPTLETAL